MPTAPLRLLLGTGLLLVLGGCSGTPFGNQLARSFSTPASPTPASPLRSPDAPVAPGVPLAPASRQAPLAGQPAATPVPGAATGASPAAIANTPQPAPYRVTIKLPAADPSAPAEAVTQALRAAGVRFEVEMIERVPGATGTAGAEKPPSPVTPAPPPR